MRIMPFARAASKGDDCIFFWIQRRWLLHYIDTALVTELCLKVVVPSRLTVSASSMSCAIERSEGLARLSRSSCSRIEGRDDLDGRAERRGRLDGTGDR